MYSSIFDELEKIGLYDPDIHSTPGALDRLRRMEGLQLQHRARTSGIPLQEWGVRDVPGLVKQNPSRLMFMSGGYWTENTPTGPKVFTPGPVARQAGLGKGVGAAAGGAHRLAIHHELDEARAMQGKVGRGVGRVGDAPTEMFAFGPPVGEQTLSSVPKSLRGPARQAFHGTMQSLGDVGEVAQNLAKAPSHITAMHADPSVLIQESNRAAMMDPASRARMSTVRNTTGEAPLMKRLGLRYGEEVIPEEGSRFTKLRAGMIGASKKQQLAQREMAEGVERIGSRLRPAVKSIGGKIRSVLQRAKP